VTRIRTVDSMDMDCLVIGNGAAGLICATRLATKGYKVGVVGEGQTSTSLSTGCITSLHPVKGEMMDRDGMRAVFPYSMEAETEDLMMVFEDMFSFLLPELDLVGLPMRGNMVTVRRMLTSVGTEYQCSIPQLFSLQGRIEDLRGSKAALLGIMGHGDSDPDMVSSMVRSWSDMEIDPYWTSPSSLEGRTDLTSSEVARLCRRTDLMDELVEAISQIDAESVGLPPLLDLDGYRKGMEYLQSRSGRKVFELITPLSLPGIRFQSALEALARSKGCSMLNGWRVTELEIDQAGVDGAILESRSRRRKVEAGALVLATGDTVGGGLNITGQTIASPLLGSREARETVELDRKGLLNISLEGIEVDDRLRPSIDGVNLRNMVTAGSVIKGFSYPSGTGMGASMFTAWKAAETVMEVLQ